MFEALKGNKTNAKKRVFDEHKRFPCYGTVHFLYSARKVKISTLHDTDHVSGDSHKRLFDECKKLIVTLTTNGMTPFQIFTSVKKEGETIALYHEVIMFVCEICSGLRKSLFSL